MAQNDITVLVICPPNHHGDGVKQRVAGLTVGERLLHSLKVNGVSRVGFLGEGERPETKIPIIPEFVPHADDPPEKPFLITVSDVVFDSGMLREGDQPDPDLPIRYLDASAWKAVVLDPYGWISLLAKGRAGFASRFAIRVDSQAAVILAERSLFRSLKNSSRSLVADYFSKPLSLFLAKLALRVGFMSRRLPLLAVAMAVVSGLTAAFADNWQLLVLSGLLFQMHFVFNRSHDHVTELTYTTLALGRVLNNIAEDLAVIFLSGGLVIGQARIMDSKLLYATGAVLLLAQVMAIATRQINARHRGQSTDNTDSGRAQPVNGTRRSKIQVVSAFALLVNKDTFYLLISVAVAVGLAIPAFCALAARTFVLGVAITVEELRRFAAGS